MGLRLGLLNQNLADRSQTSEGNCSNILATWTRFFRTFLGDSIVTRLPNDVILHFHLLLHMVIREHGVLQSTPVIVTSNIFRKSVTVRGV